MAVCIVANHHNEYCMHVGLHYTKTTPEMLDTPVKVLSTLDSHLQFGHPEKWRLQYVNTCRVLCYVVHWMANCHVAIHDSRDNTYTWTATLGSHF